MNQNDSHKFTQIRKQINTNKNMTLETIEKNKTREDEMSPEDWENLTEDGIKNDPRLIVRFLKNQLNGEMKKIIQQSLNGDGEKLQLIKDELNFFNVSFENDEIIGFLKEIESPKEFNQEENNIESKVDKLNKEKENKTDDDFLRTTPEDVKDWT